MEAKSSTGRPVYAAYATTRSTHTLWFALLALLWLAQPPIAIHHKLSMQIQGVVHFVQFVFCNGEVVSPGAASGIAAAPPGC